MPDEELPHELVDLADAGPTGVPLGVDARRDHETLDVLPEVPEPEPVRVAGHVAHEPRHLGLDGVVVVGRREEPGRGALEDREVVDLLGDLGDELRRARPGADDDDALAAEVDVVVPSSGVEGGTGEGRRARQVGDVGPVELADAADDGVGRRDRARARRPRGGGGSTRIDASSSSTGQHLGAEADEGPQAVLVGDAAEVVEQHLLGGEVLRPVVALREGVAVEEVRHVDAAARVGVLEPGAADVVVLLQHHDLDAGLVEAVGGHQPGHARRR